MTASGDDGAARRYALEGARSGAELLAELHEQERTRTRCAFCDETFEGTFRDGRAWFADHQAAAHPEVAKPERSRRRGVKR